MAALEFRAVFEASPGAYLILNPDLIIVGATDSYTRATKTQREDLIGLYVFDAFPDNPEEKNATGVANLRASLQRVLATKNSDAMAVQKYDIKTPDGRFEVHYWSPLNTPVLINHEVHYIIHSVEDVTDFVTLKQEGLRQTILTEELKTKIDETERMRQAQRLLAMGQLAGGVAHDFNNLLSVIMLNCDLLARDGIRDKQKGIDQIRKTAERAANMTHQLLAFSRTQVFQPRVVSMNTIITDLEPILKRLTREGIELKLSLDANLCNVVADVTQVEQILINLVANARDAIPGTGNIQIQTETVSLDEISARGDPAACPGKYARLTVRDTGIGMDAVTQARIFEPFFTTKEAGKGTGLGLPTIYGIVSQNQGTIRVIGEMRRGTSFNVFWPAVEAPVQVILRSEKSQVAPRSARILVVEDEDDLRTLICDTLISHDFQVESAENGEVALSNIEKSSVPFDLIITDVRMPVMTGSALKRELDRRGIRVKVLFMSGYSQEALFDPAEQEEHAFIEKPFTGTDLLSKIDAILR